MSLSVVHSALRSEGLRGRIEAACLIAASQIIAEDAGTANHANRIAWADNVLGDDGEEFTTDTARKILRYSLATNATLQSSGDNVSDNDVQFIVNSALGSPEALAAVG